MRGRLAAAALAAALLTASCSSGDDSSAGSSTTTTPGFPATIQDSRGSVTIKARPTRIVSLSATATETLFAIGAGSQVVAVDEHSDFPPSAPTTDLSGFDPDATAIAAKKPDLVVMARDKEGVLAALEKQGIAVLLESAPDNVDAAVDEIRDLGAATGHRMASDNLATTIEAEFANLGAAALNHTNLTFYWEISDRFISASSKSFIGALVATLGMKNIADGAPGATGAYPQLTADYIIKSDPDFIFLADTKSSGQTAAIVAARPGWRRLKAVRNKQIVELDDSLASRWGPRMTELLRTVARAVDQAQPPS